MSNKDWGFIEFVRHSSEYMAGSNAVLFYIKLPIAWYRFDRLQRKGKS